MKHDRNINRFVLSNGRTFWSMTDILAPGDNDGSVFYGFDGRERFLDKPLSAEEREEIATAMIARWDAWAGSMSARDREIAMLRATVVDLGKKLDEEFGPYDTETSVDILAEIDKAMGRT